MPYTPPSRSPASSGTVSPAHVRAQSHMYDSSPPRSPARPHLPRSATSTAYLQKSRRSPTFQANAPIHTRFDDEQTDSHLNNGNAVLTNLRQSPPPVTDSTIPAGAIMSPPDSAQNSSDEEEGNPTSTLNKLSDVVHNSLHVNREPASPTDDYATGDKTLRLDVPGVEPDARLSPSARKFSHSRSASAAESPLFRRDSTSSQTTSDADDSGEESDTPRPPLLRKKSGELVKPAIRPPSRRRHSSMPGTPSYSKAVHFNDNIEQVRHFLQVDRPIAVSAGTSPVESFDDEVEFPFKDRATSTSWEIRLANFPRNSFERVSKPVRVESIALSTDEKSLVGTIAVSNLAFQKTVIPRFTLDYWKTTSEVVAEYDVEANKRPRDDGCDVFKFTIKLSDQANLETRTLLICVRYCVNGQELWDSNDGQNFQIDFIKKAKSSTDQAVAPALVTRPIPRSRHNSSSSSVSSPPRGRQPASFDDDFTSGFDSNSQIRFRNHINPKPGVTGTTPPPVRRQNTAGQQFGSRYDFGASLSAALSQAQATLGDRSGLKSKNDGASTSTKTQKPAFSANAISRSGVNAPTGSGAESPRPEALLANKQTLDSRAYQDFVSKFCFFGSTKPAGPGDLKQPPNPSDGTQEDLTSLSPLTQENSNGIDADTEAGNSNRLAVPRFFNNLARSPQGLSPNSSRSQSPSPAPTPPITFGYPFHHDTHSGMFPSESYPPTAIPG